MVATTGAMAAAIATQSLAVILGQDSEAAGQSFTASLNLCLEPAMKCF